MCNMNQSRGTKTLAVAFICVLLVFGAEALGSYRKCVCTNKACRETGAKICRTRYSCYTEVIYSMDPDAEPGTFQTSRGCTEGVPPLLCDKSWRMGDEDGTSLPELSGRAAWPRLICCDDRDYCNAADEDFEPSSGRPSNGSSVNHDAAMELQIAAGKEDFTRTNPTIVGNGSSNQQNVHPLHIAALLIALAALISVFAACYVVTRFLQTGGALPRIVSSYASNRMDF